MKEYIEIVDVLSREIYDSNGVPTVETEVVLDDGTVGRASVGTNYMSTDHYSELRDGDLNRFNGMGVNLAVTNVNTEIAEALLGLNALEQSYIDKVLLEVDGTQLPPAWCKCRFKCLPCRCKGGFIFHRNELIQLSWRHLCPAHASSSGIGNRIGRGTLCRACHCIYISRGTGALPPPFIEKQRV